jgi:ribosomal protein S18 acetylase RimI-like enzyme
MTLAISDLDNVWQPHAVEYLRRAPYRNAIPLANVTQLRANCVVVVAHSRGLIQGVVSHYRELPFLAVTFVAELGDPLPTLLAALAERIPTLRTDTISTVVPEHRARQLSQYGKVESLELEWQMVVEPETLKPYDLPAVRRLQEADLPAMQALAQQVGIVTWRPATLANGPAIGAFADDQLVAMAATHFATTDVIEIGNVVTHPAYRRQGFARACVSTLARACFTLAPRVYLLVMDDNDNAFAAYRQLGFWPAERFAFVRFRL